MITQLCRVGAWTLTDPDAFVQSFLGVSVNLHLWPAPKHTHAQRGILLLSCYIVSDSLRPHGLQHGRLPCSSVSPGVCSKSCPSSWWCHPTISSSVVPFSFCLQSFPASESFLMSWLFASDDQSIGASASASVLPMNIQGWFPLGWTGLISLLSKGLSSLL